MLVRGLEEAATDLEIARDFYDQMQPGIGSYCVDSLLAGIERLATLHGVRSQHFGCFRMLASRVPFGIYYREAGQYVEVVAVDLRRDPDWLRAEMARRRR